MRFFGRVIFSFFSNAIALLLAAEYIAGFEIAGGLPGLLSVALVFTAITIFVRPFFRFVLTPLIILTLGLGIFVVNAGMLWLLDFFSEQVTIQGLGTLLFATLLISALHFIINISARALFRT
ncbi:MAG: phage holin family protein [bacterium]|nr:phage holin family protein [bacterium]